MDPLDSDAIHPSWSALHLANLKVEVGPDAETDPRARVLQPASEESFLQRIAHSHEQQAGVRLPDPRDDVVLVRGREVTVHRSGDGQSGMLGLQHFGDTLRDSGPGTENVDG